MWDDNGTWMDAPRTETAGKQETLEAIEKLEEEIRKEAKAEGFPLEGAAEGLTEETKAEKPSFEAAAERAGSMKKNFAFFGPATMLYALFYALCMYRNGSGITFPFFLAGSLWYFCSSIKKLGITLKKGSVFYMGTVMLLAISTFCTDDARMIAFNKTGIFLLMISFLLDQFCRTARWGLGKYLLSIVTLLCSALMEIAAPIADGKELFTKQSGRESRRTVYYVFLGVVICIPILLVVLALLSSADIVFRSVTEKLLLAVDFENILGVIFAVCLWYFMVYMLLARLCKGAIREEVTDHRNGEPILAITITAMLSFLYLVFSGIQIVYLFAGNMQLPYGYTYCEYAREGFFQLLAVSIINLIIVLFCMAYFRESKILKGILTVMSLCTFVMIASSAKRMIYYIRYGYLTFLRILVLWALAVLFLFFVGVVLQIYREKFPLFRYGVTVVSIFYISLSFAHPDYWIAKVNVANALQSMEQVEEYARGNGEWIVSEQDFFQSETPYHDYRYLSYLSADAAPVLIPYLTRMGYDFRMFDTPARAGKVRGSADEFGYYFLETIRERTQDMGIRGFNLSRYTALQLIREAQQ